MISSQDMVLFSVIFVQFLLFYFPGYNVIKSKSRNIETVFPLYFLDTQPMSLKVNQIQYPVWASLAPNYLPIMASSVSSERAFSSLGITITRQPN